MIQSFFVNKYHFITVLGVINGVFLDCFGGLVCGRVLRCGERQAPYRAWLWQFLGTLMFSSRACLRVLITHTLSIIITDCSLANNFILSFLSDSCLVRLFLDFSWREFGWGLCVLGHRTPCLAWVWAIFGHGVA